MLQAAPLGAFMTEKDIRAVVGDNIGLHTHFSHVLIYLNYSDIRAVVGENIGVHIQFSLVLIYLIFGDNVDIQVYTCILVVCSYM